MAYKWSWAFDLRCVFHGGTIFKFMRASEAFSAVNMLHNAAQPKVDSRWKKTTLTLIGGENKGNDHDAVETVRQCNRPSSQRPCLAHWSTAVLGSVGVSIQPPPRRHHHAYGSWSTGPASSKCASSTCAADRSQRWRARINAVKSLSFHSSWLTAACKSCRSSS